MKVIIAKCGWRTKGFLFELIKLIFLLCGCHNFTNYVLSVSYLVYTHAGGHEVKSSLVHIIVVFTLFVVFIVILTIVAIVELFLSKNITIFAVSQIFRFLQNLTVSVVYISV
jgi:hypothetical protein